MRCVVKGKWDGLELVIKQSFSPQWFSGVSYTCIHHKNQVDRVGHLRETLNHKLMTDRVWFTGATYRF